MSKEVLLEAKEICKAFGPTVALDHVNFRLHRGEIRGLIGENGCGKSTLTSILCGAQKADSGEMQFHGHAHSPANVVEAQKQGIAMILQEAGTISGLTVAQNIFIGSERMFARGGFVNRKAMYQAADALLTRLGLTEFHGSDRIDRYSFEQRKLLEIVRALKDEPDVLVVDETTTALSHNGRQLLYRLVRSMAEAGKGVIFISHDLDEVLDVCTVLSVLRDGREVGELTKAEMEPSLVRQMMVGREISDKYYREDYDASCSDEVALSFRKASCGRIRDFSLEVHRGEIVGIGGLSGDGMHDVGRMAFGLEHLSSGEVMHQGKAVLSPRQAISQGIGYISKDRDKAALVLSGSIEDNLVMPSLQSIARHGFISPRAEKTLSANTIDSLTIKCRNRRQLVRELSGGNKQKVSFGKWIAKGSDVIIMDCPTRGVDIGVKQAMYELITQMKHEGKAILFISEELSELIGMCDRIEIMKDFRISKEFMRSPNLKDSDMIEYMI